ncbi:MAG: hypothetical protein D9V45_07270 [Chloroflexi bacterium]|nr:hypothetical protein [Anaerolinea sp.]TDA66720.1 MAG: hypothetical protein D9V45_07270 [Chloroflexota bacterium]
MSLTRGNPVGAWAVLDNLRLEYGSYTKVLRQGGSNPTLIGQMHYTAGERAARLTFVTPERGLDSPGLAALLESLAWEAGERGACSLLAEVEESSPAFEVLRRTGFSVYGWQRVWKINEPINNNNVPNVWETSNDLDALPIRALYQALVPPLVQTADPLVERAMTGLVYEQNGELLAYIEPTYGPMGIYLQPLIHPAVDDVLRLVRSFLGGLSFQLGRQVYLSIRSYQAWLENALSELDVEVSPRQALLVKHLVVQQRSPAFAAARNGTFENRQPAMITSPNGEQPLPLIPTSFKRSRPQAPCQG